MNILKIMGINEVPVGTLANIHQVYKTQGDEYVYGRMDDRAYLGFIETLWADPELSLRNLLK